MRAFCALAVSTTANFLPTSRTSLTLCMTSFSRETRCTSLDSLRTSRSKASLDSVLTRARRFTRPWMDRRMVCDGVVCSCWLVALSGREVRRRQVLQVLCDQLDAGVQHLDGVGLSRQARDQLLVLARERVRVGHGAVGLVRH